jgi:hypothetical protein
MRTRRSNKLNRKPIRKSKRIQNIKAKLKAYPWKILKSINAPDLSAYMEEWNKSARKKPFQDLLFNTQYYRNKEYHARVSSPVRYRMKYLFEPSWMRFWPILFNWNIVYKRKRGPPKT